MLITQKRALFAKFKRTPSADSLNAPTTFRQCCLLQGDKTNSKLMDVTSSICMSKKEEKSWSQGWLIAAGAHPRFCSMKRLEVFLLPLHGMLVRRRSLPRNFVRLPQQFAGTHLYTWAERRTVRVKCLAEEHNTMCPAGARTPTSEVERSHHEATTPPII